MKQVFLIIRSGISGGTGTLSIRIGEWLVNHGYEVLYICQNFNDMNNVNSMKEKGIKVCQWKIKEISKNLSQMYDRCKFHVLTYSLDEYLYVETLRNKINIAKSTLYVVSSKGLIKGSQLGIFSKLIALKFYGRLIQKIIDRNNVIFMDEVTLDLTKEYFGLTMKNKIDSTYYLPMEIKPYNGNSILKKIESEKFNVLAIARADFPFKGYIIGLVDDFQELCKNYDNITLTIITFGEDEYKVSEKIKELPSIIQNKINLIGQTPYDKLNTYFNQAHLYLGMGTTILDAVNNGVPSITVQAYTYSNNSSGFFHMQPEFLAAYEDRSVPAATYIKKVIKMNKHEYIELCEVEHKKLEEYYDIETFTNYLLNTEKEVESKGLFSFELKIHELMVNLNKVINRFKRVV